MIDIITTFRNQTAHRVPVLDYSKRLLFTILPGETRFLPDGSLQDDDFDQWSEIIFQVDGSVKLKSNRNWVRPEGWCTVFENQGFHSVEGYKVLDEYFYFFRGIPRTLAMPLDSPDVFFEKIIFVPATQTVPHWADGRKTFEFQTSKIEKIQRSEMDCARIKAELARSAIETSVNESDRHLERLTKGLK
jgi:hypothetical protein